MATLKAFKGRALKIRVGAKDLVPGSVTDATPNGVTVPLNMTGRVAWVRRDSASGFVPIDGSSVVVASPEEVALYKSDPAKETLLIVNLPASEAAGSFAMLPMADIYVFVGSSEGAADATLPMAPERIIRIGPESTEGVVL